MLKNKFILQKESKLEDAIRLMDKIGNGVLAVVDSKDKLIGLITDGDIRRAILNKSLDLKSVINKNPITMPYTSTKNQIIQKLKSIHKRQMPLIDEKNNLIDLFILDDIEFNSKPNKVVIMAGGLGSRLGHLTKNMPKPMLQVGKKPMLENLIDIFSEYGFSNFYISVNYKSEIIKEYFKDGKKFGVNIKYIEEEKRMGTAGSLSLIKDKIDEPFFVINGDVLTTLNFENLLEFHIKHNSFATMCVRKYEYQIPYGVIKSNNNIINFIEEKPIYNFFVNAGIYVLQPDIIKFIPKDNFYDMPNLFKLLIKRKKRVFSYEVSGYWKDIGHIEDYEAVLDDFEY